ncbi:MAG TPA: competence/damage-inducible protein A [Actinomycetota bacterium]|nr:competence/damage-inducible protein A [Actinomycetota bacterium]
MAEIIGVGTEILLGQITNSNAQWISERLAEIGIDVLHHQVVGDNDERIADTLRLALSRADVVIATGGLGPTQDDITRDAVAAALGLSLVRRREIEEFLRDKFDRLGREMPESNLRQADVPEGARYILPERGTAPGLICKTPEGKRVYVVPGVPAEMREMMEGTILVELRSLAGPAAITSRIIKATGIAEAKVAEILDDLFHSSTNPTLAYLASSGEVKVRITAKAATQDEAEALIEPVAEDVVRRLGDRVFTTADEDLAEVVGGLLRDRGKTAAVAESMTAGTLAARLSWQPGASAYFVGGAVCYTPDVKREVLGVSTQTLAGPGVVSEECAREMASGARRLFGAHIGVAITGAAGPEPHGGKPPGTVCIAVAGESGVESRTFRAPGDREQVRRWAEQGALDLARRYLETGPRTMEAQAQTPASSR